MQSDKTNLIPEDFDLRFQRAFGLLAFSVNRHIVDHMRRLCIELSLDPETAQIWGSLAHLNVLPNLLRIPAKLDSDSTPSWTSIPEQAGQSERSDAGFWSFTLLMPWGSSFCRTT